MKKYAQNGASQAKLCLFLRCIPKHPQLRNKCHYFRPYPHIEILSKPDNEMHFVALSLNKNFMGFILLQRHRRLA